MHKFLSFSHQGEISSFLPSSLVPTSSPPPPLPPPLLLLLLSFFCFFPSLSVSLFFLSFFLRRGLVCTLKIPEVWSNDVYNITHFVAVKSVHTSPFFTCLVSSLWPSGLSAVPPLPQSSLWISSKDFLHQCLSCFPKGQELVLLSFVCPDLSAQFPTHTQKYLINVWWKKTNGNQESIIMSKWILTKAASLKGNCQVMQSRAKISVFTLGFTSPMSDTGLFWRQDSELSCQARNAFESRLLGVIKLGI